MTDTPSGSGVATPAEVTAGASTEHVSAVGETAVGGPGTVPDTRLPTDLPPGTMVGDYRIEGVLGAGGMGQVYAATHPVIGKRAAIKILRAELSVNRETVERFVLEARAVNQIGHPNIVDVFAFGALFDGRSYFVMEWLKGESLRSRMHRRMSIVEVAHVVDSVCTALEAAHEKGIVHRDLKPDNVFLVDVRNARPMVKLLDFGIAKLLGSEDTRMERTRTGNLLGTPAYIAPEQARGEVIDQRVDVYSLGAMAYEMLAREVPFPARSPMDMIARHLYNDPPALRDKLPDAPVELDRLLTRMMAKSPEDRPSLDEVRAVMARAVNAEAETPAVVPPFTVDRAPTSPEVAAPRRARWLVPLLLVVAAGIAAAVVLTTRGRDEEAAAPTPAVTTPDAAVRAAMTVDAAPAIISVDAAPAPVVDTAAAPAAPTANDKPARDRKSSHRAKDRKRARDTSKRDTTRPPPPRPDDDAPMEPK